MGYDRGDGFSFNFEPNGIPFGSESKGKLSPRLYPNQFERKWNTSFLSVASIEPASHKQLYVRMNNLTCSVARY